MSCHLDAVSFDAFDPARLATFWGGVLGREVSDGPDGVALLSGDDTGYRIRFLPSEAPKSGPNQIHFDLTSTSLEDQQATVARVLELGGDHLDIGQDPDDDHVVMADPEGNEFCVIEAGNNFLADTALIGAINCDGTQAVGYFWSRALGWPLVWDQDEETAIQSPRGGSKMSWGGPPLNPKAGRNRLRLDLAPPSDGDQEEEVERLLLLGATRLDVQLGPATSAQSSSPTPTATSSGS